MGYLRGTKAVAQNHLTEALIEIATSPINKTGSFSTRDIANGELIRTMSGDTVNQREVLRRIKRGKLSPDDPLQIGEDAYIDLDRPSLAINHSCNPNAGIRGRNELVAIRDIAAGEEVTFDYSTTVTSNIEPFAWSMDCNCQSENCRMAIGNVSTVPKEMLSAYFQLGALQSYIIDELGLSLKEEAGHRRSGSEHTNGT